MVRSRGFASASCAGYNFFVRQALVEFTYQFSNKVLAHFYVFVTNSILALERVNRMILCSQLRFFHSIVFGFFTFTFFFIVDSWIKLSVFIIEKVLKTFLFILYWTSIIFARTFILNFYLLFFSPHSYRFNESLLIVYFTHFFLFFSMYFLSSFHLFMCIFCIICCRYAFIFTISLDYCFSCGGHIHTNTHEHHRPFDFSIRFWEQRFCQLHNWRLRRLFRITRQLKSIDDTHTANNKHCN